MQAWIEFGFKKAAGAAVDTGVNLDLRVVYVCTARAKAQRAILGCKKAAAEAVRSEGLGGELGSAAFALQLEHFPLLLELLALLLILTQCLRPTWLTFSR